MPTIEDIQAARDYLDVLRGDVALGAIIAIGGRIPQHAAEAGRLALLFPDLAAAIRDLPANIPDSMRQIADGALSLLAGAATPSAVV